MMFRKQRWVAVAIIVGGAALIAIPPLIAQDVAGQRSAAAASVLAPADQDLTADQDAAAESEDTVLPLRTAPMFSRLPLPSDKIADVFRTQSQGAAQHQQNGDQSVENAESLDDVDATQDEMAQWIDQLGWTAFADRERATGKLRSAGKRALPSLRTAMQAHPDLEVRMRARDVAAGIAGNETAGRVDAFLAGQDVPMEGWTVAQKILGDGVRVRELFVEIYLRHEAAAAALEGSTKQRTEAFRSTIVEIQRAMFVEHRSPTEADLISLLLLANDQDMPMSGVEEDALLALMRREAKSRLLVDPQLSGLFRSLLSGWISRLDPRHPENMLWLALDCDLDDALPLAVETLQKSTEPPTLAISMQAIARFGDKTNINDVAKYLDDERAASEVQYFGGNVIESQLRDAAMATIVLLSDRKLADFDMDDNAVHPKAGFMVQAIGFPIENNELRLQAIEKVKKELVPAK